MASPAAGDHADDPFLGDDCVLIDDENSDWDGWYECTIAQPEGDHATHGKAYYQRTTDADTDEITFVFAPDPDDLEEVQICITDSFASSDDPDGDGNPYTPTDAFTCSGQDANPVYDPVWKSDDDDYDNSDVNGHPAVTIDLLALFDESFDPGDAIWFAVHINVDEETNYIAGSSTVASDDDHTYECRAATVTTNTAVLKGYTDDTSVTIDDVVFTLNSTTYDAVSETNDVFSSETVTGLTPNTQYSYTVSFVDGTADDQTCRFRTSAVAPTYECRAATVTTNTAVLKGYTNDTSVTIDDVVFTLNSTTYDAVSETNDVFSSETVTGLTPNTQYSYTVSFVDGTADDQTCRFTTSAEEAQFRSLTVTKDFVGQIGNPRIEVTVDCDGTDFDQTFSLGDNGSRTISNIPDGTECTVSENPFEDDVAEEGSGEDSVFWNETVNGQPGTTIDVVLSQNRSVAFVNTRTVVQGETEERPPPPPPNPPPVVNPPPVNPPPVSPPAPNVQPNVVERPTEVRGAVLARTGTDTKPLALTGFAMILAGAALVFLTRRPRTNPIA